MHTRSNVKNPCRKGKDEILQDTVYHRLEEHAISTGVSHFRFFLVQEGLNRYKAPALGFAAPAGRIMLRRSDLRVGLEIQIGNVHRRDRQFTFGTFIEP